MATKFDYQGALQAGYSDEEISQYLKEQNPSFDYKNAVESGYSPSEINEYLSSYSAPSTERSKKAKAGRVGLQFAKGALQGALLLPDIAGIASKEFMKAPGVSEEAYRRSVFEDIERLSEQKQTGVWDEQDETLYQNLIEQVRNPKKMQEVLEAGKEAREEISLAPSDIITKGFEKATGIDTRPEGILEHAANWTGFIKDPVNISKLAKNGLKTKDVYKALAPSGMDIMRGLGAGTALTMAEDGQLGPIGTMAAAVVGDLAGVGLSKGLKSTLGLITKPRETLARGFAKFTPREKLNLQKDLIDDFRKSGLQADVGTLTDSEILKWTQSKLSQSGLTGKGLENLKREITDQIKKEYKSLAESLGEARYSTLHEAGEAAKEAIKSIREADLASTRSLYKSANSALKEGAFVESRKLADTISRIEKELKPGQIKSVEQQNVLKALDTLKRDLYDSSGNLMYANVKDLMNNKIALNDIINYEVQGGAKQLLKEVVGDIDRSIISYGKKNPSFAKNYINANKKFAEHAKSFRNKEVESILKSNPDTIMNKMNSVKGIKEIEKILVKTPEGKEVLNGLKKLKLDRVIGDNMVDSTTQQIKLGTFSKLLEKGKNREVIGEIVGKQNLQRLERLQKNAGKLADTANKFYNASKSGATVADVAVVSKALTDISNLLVGNPWPLAKTAAGIGGARYISHLLGDPSFLKLVEEAIKASEKNDMNALIRLGEEMVRPIQVAIMLSQKGKEENEQQEI